MLRTRLRSALGRRKIETLSLATIAAFSSIGIVIHDGSPTESLTAVATPQVQYLAAKATSAPVPEVAAASMDLPNLEHPRVDSWIKRFTGDQRRSYATYLSRMAKYEPMISKKLAERDMPQGLIYLAMIESGFNPTAKSRVAATGLWQFMRATGREYGLKVSGKVDERRNPARATDAALEYLSDLHDRFGSWYLAAAAYNVGQGRVAKVMKQVTGKTKGTDADYYRIANRLPKETREYVPKMIAAARIGTNPEKYGFSVDE
ncbi:MAG TPA: lytic transglycosylase domain-containing protein [Gemmatimonadaceae bacterium]|nr:lytic transglycosylase domain-containing protein [Gemmatimonadaceae bacterium]